MTSDPTYRSHHIKEQANREAELLKSMNDRADEMARARGVDTSKPAEKYNPAFAGTKFKSYFDGLNAEARLG